MSAPKKKEISMKVRSGFVSNSSTSSFLLVGFEILPKDVEKYEEVIGMDTEGCDGTEAFYIEKDDKPIIAQSQEKIKSSVSFYVSVIVDWDSGDALIQEKHILELNKLMKEEKDLRVYHREINQGSEYVDYGVKCLFEGYGEGDDEVLLRLLAGDIRIGAYDVPSPRREAVRRLLWSITAQKLRESNPDFLAAGGSD